MADVFVEKWSLSLSSLSQERFLLSCLSWTHASGARAKILQWPKNASEWYICAFLRQKHGPLSFIESQVTLHNKTMASLCSPCFLADMQNNAAIVGGPAGWMVSSATLEAGLPWARAAGFGKLPVCRHVSVRKGKDPFEHVGCLATQGNMQSTLSAALCFASWLSLNTLRVGGND